MAERSYRKLFWALAASGLVLDQVAKYGVFRWLYNDGRGDRREYVSNVFEVVTNFTRETGGGLLRTWGGEQMPVVNHGALFSFLNEGAHIGLANALFAAISVAAAVAIVWWSSRPSARRELGLSAALGLILAGTLGNLYDRLVFGGVRDFLHLHYYTREWPVFNLADCCLVCGAVLLLGQAFLGKAPAAAPAPAQEMAEAR
jgi:lipoprotein signal peptidase